MSRLALLVVLPVLALLALVLAVLSLRSVAEAPGHEPVPRRKAHRPAGPVATARSLARPAMERTPAVVVAP